jgi:hypothetical protein
VFILCSSDLKVYIQIPKARQPEFIICTFRRLKIYTFVCKSIYLLLANESRFTESSDLLQ